MPAPERRTRWDMAAAAALALVVLVVAAGLWWASDARRTSVLTGSASVSPLPPPRTLPSGLAEAWRAPSPATPTPLVQGATAVTGAGGTVTGRDLTTGAPRWSYRRDRPLCTVSTAFHQVITVYLRGENCREVTALDWSSGRRGPQRTGPVEVPTRLVTAGNLVAASGRRYLEVWRSDLVRTLAYGRLPAPAQPHTQPRPDCLRGSIALSSDTATGRTGETESRLAVLEHCPGEPARLTVQRPDPKEPDQPEVIFSVSLPGPQGRVVALTADRVAVALPDPARLVVLDGAGKTLTERPLEIPDIDLRGDPAGGVVTLTGTPSGLYWFTGSATVALDVTQLLPRWTYPESLGSGTELAGALLVPVPDAIAVLDTTTGKQIGALPVARGGYRGPVAIASSGELILELRRDTLVALRPYPPR